VKEVPKPERVTIRLSLHDRKILDRLCREKGWSKSKAFRWLVRMIGKQLSMVDIGKIDYDNALMFKGAILRGEVIFEPGEVNIKLPKKVEGWKIIVEYV